MSIERYSERAGALVESAVHRDRPTALSPLYSGLSPAALPLSALQRGWVFNAALQSHRRATSDAETGVTHQSEANRSETKPLSGVNREKDTHLSSHKNTAKPNADNTLLTSLSSVAMGNSRNQPTVPDPVTEQQLAENMLQSPRAQELRAVIERCTRLAMIAESQMGAGELLAQQGDIRIRLTAELFADTELVLRRPCRGKGWALSIDSGSREHSDLLAGATTMLRQQFVQRGLGDIQIFPSPNAILD